MIKIIDNCSCVYKKTINDSTPKITLIFFTLLALSIILSVPVFSVDNISLPLANKRVHCW